MQIGGADLTGAKQLSNYSAMDDVLTHVLMKVETHNHQRQFPLSPHRPAQA
jgi:phosphoribosylformylglycinamidine (FGAM) synthase-like enzyme